MEIWFPWQIPHGYICSHADAFVRHVRRRLDALNLGVCCIACVICATKRRCGERKARTLCTHNTRQWDFRSEDRSGSPMSQTLEHMLRIPALVASEAVGELSIWMTARRCLADHSPKQPGNYFGGPRGSTYNDGKSERSRAHCPARTQFPHSGRAPGSLGQFQARVSAGEFWPLKYPRKTTLRNVPESPRDLARSRVRSR